MNISGIRTYAGFYDYNTIKQSEIRSRQIQEAKSGMEKEVPFSAEEQKAEEPVLASARDNGAKEFTEKYQPEAVYEMKGEDSDIAKLDVEKAISDMKKDEILMEYQFFVNSATLEYVATDNIQEQFVL